MGACRGRGARVGAAPPENKSSIWGGGGGGAFLLHFLYVEAFLLRCSLCEGPFLSSTIYFGPLHAVPFYLRLGS